ncbi:MAG: hypothetical protein ABFC38_10545 [Methanospirillum sp.]
MANGMSDAKIRFYRDKVPKEIRNAIAPLYNDKAWAIFAALLSNRRMTFTEIKTEFEAESPGDIDKYIKALVHAGLVAQRAKYECDIEDISRARYEVTIVGKELVTGLFEHLLPVPRVGFVAARRVSARPAPQTFTQYSGFHPDYIDYNRTLRHVKPVEPSCMAELFTESSKITTDGVINCACRE